MGIPVEIPEPTSDQPKLRLEKVSRTFKAASGRLVALENIDLEVREGEFLCLVGPSGCGKSTLLNIMAGLDETAGLRL